MLGLLVFSAFSIFCFACMLHEILLIPTRISTRNVVVDFRMNKLITDRTTFPRLQCFSNIEIIKSNE